MLNNLRHILDDNLFEFALFISALVHLLLLVQVSFWRMEAPPAPKLVYLPMKESRPAPPQYLPPAEGDKEEKRMSLRKERFKEEDIGKKAFPRAKTSLKVSALVVEKMKKVDLLSPEKIDDELFKKMIEVQEVPADPKVKAYYLDYYDKIRRKIRNNAYKLYRKGMRSGDVFVSFLLDRDGRLLEAHVVPERSDGGRILWEIALEALSRSTPFGAFPPELVQAKLRFNVIISFRKR